MKPISSCQEANYDRTISLKAEADHPIARSLVVSKFHNGIHDPILDNTGVTHSVTTAFVMNAVGTEWVASGLPGMA